VIVDELTELLDIGGSEDSPFEKELNSLVNVYARNCSLWLTICHQEAYQIRPYTYKTLMGMGTQVLGVIADVQAALQVAGDIFTLSPYRLKAVDTVWGSKSVPGYVYDRTREEERLVMYSEPTPIDSRPVYLSHDEQSHQNAYGLMNLKKFEFYVKVAPDEGQMSREIRTVHIKGLDEGTWVDEHAVAEWRERLRSTTGTPVADILCEISERTVGNDSNGGRQYTSHQAHGHYPSDDVESSDPDYWDAGRQ